MFVIATTKAKFCRLLAEQGFEVSPRQCTLEKVRGSGSYYLEWDVVINGAVHHHCVAYLRSVFGRCRLTVSNGWHDSDIEKVIAFDDLARLGMVMEVPDKH